jgi:hypothetical protein
MGAAMSCARRPRLATSEKQTRESWLIAGKKGKKKEKKKKKKGKR